LNGLKSEKDVFGLSHETRCFALEDFVYSGIPPRLSDLPADAARRRWGTYSSNRLEAGLLLGTY
jgi:hypothetical protein